MIIGGFIKTSLVDYPGKIASVIFTKGCNFNCYYCHNKNLINFDANSNKDLYPEDEIFTWLIGRKKLINHVVISGGEPTVQKDLVFFLEKLKNLGFKIKLDTNGTDIELISYIIQKGLIDFIAMDIKAPMDKYKIICQNDNLDISNIVRSIERIKNSGLDYEFRTTFCSLLNTDDIFRIIEDFNIKSNYVVQRCRYEENLCSANEEEKLKKYEHGFEFGKSFCFKTRGFVKPIRGIIK